MKPTGNGFFLENFFGQIFSPFEQFQRRTAAGGIILIATVAVSLILANSGSGRYIFSIWELPVSISIADWHLEMTLHKVVNDGIMTLFFLLVGLELKRELIVGELSSLKDATLPIAAALGGMLAPALIYWIINPVGPASRGWGIPMATDIAFAVGILVLLDWRIPASLIIFLTALAIADDLGAVAVIAFFYTREMAVSAMIISTLAARSSFYYKPGEGYDILSLMRSLDCFCGFHCSSAGCIRHLPESYSPVPFRPNQRSLLVSLQRGSNSCRRNCKKNHRTHMPAIMPLAALRWLSWQRTWRKRQERYSPLNSV